MTKKEDRIFTEGTAEEPDALFPAPDGVDPAFAKKLTIEVAQLLVHPDVVQISEQPADRSLAEKVSSLEPVFETWRDLVGPEGEGGDSAAAFAMALLEEQGKDGEEQGEDAGDDGEEQGEDAGDDGEEQGEDAGDDGEEPGEDGEEQGEDGEEQGEDGEEQGEDAGDDGEEQGEDGEEQGEDAGDDGEEQREDGEESDPEYDLLIVEISPAQEGEQEEDEEEGLEEGGGKDGKEEGEGGEAKEGEGEEGEDESDREEEADPKEESSVILQISGSLKPARDDKTELLSKILPSLRHGPEDPMSTVDTEKLNELARLFERQPEWKKLLDLIGRLSASAWSPPARVPSKAREDVLDLELGDDTSRILTSELARLSVPELAALAWVDLAERRMRQIVYEGNEPRTNGPILVAVDVSPSMDDPSGLLIPSDEAPEIQVLHAGGSTFKAVDPKQMSRKKLAMVLLLSLIRIADVQRRKVFFCGFGQRLCWERTVKTPEEAVEACLFLLRGPPEGEGTNFDPPLERLCREASKDPRGGGDLLIITDGEAGVSESTKALLETTKKKTMSRLFSLIVSNSGGGALESISEETVRLSSWEELQQLANQVSSR